MPTRRTFTTVARLLDGHILIPLFTHRALESTIKKHATGSGSSAFSGQGRTLGGSSAPEPRADSGGRPNFEAKFTNLDPQVRVLLGLLGAYLVFWYFG